MMPRLVAAMLLILPILPSRAGTLPSVEWTACGSAIRTTERALHLPPHLLAAIGAVESGRIDPQRGTLVPWPWAVDVAGIGHFYQTRSQAVAAVRAFQATGIQSIDVGCMQVNLRDHPTAFASLQDAFDPGINTVYAGRYLLELFREFNNWPQAAASYHSRTPKIATPYQKRVMAVWVDPYHVATPDFDARLLADATRRAARDAAMRGSRRSLRASKKHDWPVLILAAHQRSPSQ